MNLNTELKLCKLKVNFVSVVTMGLMIGGSGFDSQAN